MSDNNYMNTYVNLAVETVHNYLNDILQLKTQLSLVNSLISEKDQAIASLTEEKERSVQSLNSKLQSLKDEHQKHQGDEAEMQKLRDNAATWEFQYNNMMNKVSVLDTLTNQYNELEKQLNEARNKNTEYENKIREHEDVKREYDSKIADFETKIKTLESEISSTKTKLEKFEKKEEKKSSPVSEKKSINKEESKSTSIPTRMEKLKETDDDF